VRRTDISPVAKAMQNARAGQFHQRDHTVVAKTAGKIIARIVAQF